MRWNFNKLTWYIGYIQHYLRCTSRKSLNILLNSVSLCHDASGRKILRKQQKLNCNLVYTVAASVVIGSYCNVLFSSGFVLHLLSHFWRHSEAPFALVLFCFFSPPAPLSVKPLSPAVMAMMMMMVVTHLLMRNLFSEWLEDNYYTLWYLFVGGAASALGNGAAAPVGRVYESAAAATATASSASKTRQSGRNLNLN